MMPHITHLAEIYPLDGRSVVDVGAGKGAFAKQLAGHGAHVTGIEIDEAKVARAQARLPAGIRMLEGRGEAMPLDTASQDLVCFMFSLHHIPQEVHDRTFAEAARVLKPDGHLHVVEPLPDGSAHGPMALLDDETLVRTQSHARLQALANEGQFALTDSRQYELAYQYESFDAFVNSVIQVDPARAEKLPAVRDQMERIFNEQARRVDGQYCFEQPCTAYHFKKCDP